MKRLFIIFSTILFVCILISCTETSYTVDFDSNGGTGVLSQTVLSGEFATKPQDPTYKGHTFIHWALEGVEFKFDEYPIVASITLTAVWAPDEGVNKHTVTFDSQGVRVLMPKKLSKTDLLLSLQILRMLVIPFYTGH